MDCFRDLDKSLNNYQIGLMKMKLKGLVRKRRFLSRKSFGLFQVRSFRGKGFDRQEKLVVISFLSFNLQSRRNKSNIGIDLDSGKFCDNDCIVIVDDSSGDFNERQGNKEILSIKDFVVRQIEEQFCQQRNINNLEERDCEKNCIFEVRV